MLTGQCKYDLDTAEYELLIIENGAVVDRIPYHNNKKLLFFIKNCDIFKHYRNKLLPLGFAKDFYNAIFNNRISCKLLSTFAKEHKLGFPSTYFCHQCRFYYTNGDKNDY